MVNASIRDDMRQHLSRLIWLWGALGLVLFMGTSRIAWAGINFCGSGSEAFTNASVTLTGFPVSICNCTITEVNTDFFVENGSSFSATGSDCHLTFELDKDSTLTIMYSSILSYKKLTVIGTSGLPFVTLDNATISIETEVEFINVTLTDDPIQLTDHLVLDIEDLQLPSNMLKSYTANLKKVNRFISRSRSVPAINQLFAFICKVEDDVADGDIDNSTGSDLISQAENIVLELGGDPNSRVCN